MNLQENLKENVYPGRLILLGRVGNGDLVAALLLTGRSDVSKRRCIINGEGDNLLKVAPTGHDTPHDDLRHYIAAIRNGNWLILGNGDHVASLAAGCSVDSPPLKAFTDITYEPDPPIYTPRIAIAVDNNAGSSWALSAQRQKDSHQVVRTLWQIDCLAVGQALVLSTYISNGNDITTNRELAIVNTIAETAEQLLDEVWSVIKPSLRVAAASIVLSRTGIKIGPALANDQPTIARTM